MFKCRDNMDYDYSNFDIMTTDELNEILRQDSFLLSANEFDIDVIVYITELIVCRTQEQLKSQFNAEMVWKSFCDNYLPKAYQ